MFYISVWDWLSLLPFVGTVSLLSYVTSQAFKPKPPPKKSPVNLKIQKESAKVVNIVDLEDLADKVTYCRCWRSKRVNISLLQMLEVKKGKYFGNIPKSIFNDGAK